jgi:predicted ArsR family transcriptional regulator
VLQREHPHEDLGRAARFYAATRAGKKKVTAPLDPPAHKQLKQLSLDRDTNVETLLVEAINDLFKKYGKPPIA